MRFGIPQGDHVCRGGSAGRGLFLLHRPCALPRRASECGMAANDGSIDALSTSSEVRSLSSIDSIMNASTHADQKSAEESVPMAHAFSAAPQGRKEPRRDQPP